MERFAIKTYWFLPYKASLSCTTHPPPPPGRSSARPWTGRGSSSWIPCWWTWDSSLLSRECHVTISLTSAHWQDSALTELSAHSSSSPPAGSLCPGAGAVSQPAISHVVNITRTVLYHSALHCTHRNPYCAILTATPRTSILLFSEETSQSARQSVGRIGIIWLSSRRSWGRYVRSYDAVIITDTVYTSHAHYSLVYS